MEPVAYRRSRDASHSLLGTGDSIYEPKIRFLVTHFNICQIIIIIIIIIEFV